MLSLEQTATTDWLRTIRPARSDWPPPIRPIETTGDAPDLLAQLGNVLNRWSRNQPERLVGLLIALEMQISLRSVLAQLGAARLLQILSWLSQSGISDAPILVARLTEGPTPEAQALRAALAAIGRQELLERLFAIDRVAALAAATATLKEDQE